MRRLGGTLSVLLIVFATLPAQALNPPSREAMELCKLYVRQMDPILAREPKIFWPSNFLKWRGPLVRVLGNKEAAKARAKEIIDSMYANESPLGDEFAKYFAKIAAQSDGWYDFYMKSYDTFLYSPLYQEVMARAHDYLPKQGRILDVGVGPALIAGYLASGPTSRTVSGFDNQAIVKMAERRMHALLPFSGAYDMIPLYLTPISEIPGPPAEGALMNHVLYLLPQPTKKQALKAIHAKLKSGGTFVLNEPLREKATPRENFKAWVTKMVETAIDNGSPCSEFDVAFLAGMASGRSTRDLRGATKEHPFLSEKELETLVKESGFEIVDSGYSYGGFSRFLVLRKK